MDQQTTFSFGKNWEHFIENYFTNERVSISQKHILNFLQMDHLEGNYFLDVGCGSGLSSLAAVRAGAKRVVSFDVDPYAVKTTEKIRALEGSPQNWTVFQGSVLDREFMSTLEPADIVYSWGVLHHTGSMWEAVENTMPLTKKDGVFYIALYTTTPKSPYWIRVKQAYNRASWLKKRSMEASYVAQYTILPHLRHGRNPLTYVRKYKESRGMAYMTDIRDWLGGWPYEDASVEEVTSFFEDQDFTMIKIKTGEANTEYLFTPNSQMGQGDH